METTIDSLEEELAAESGEKEKALCRNEGLDSEITALTEKLEHSNTQLEHLQKDVTELVRLNMQLMIDSYVVDIEFEAINVFKTQCICSTVCFCLVPENET